MPRATRGRREAKEGDRASIALAIATTVILLGALAIRSRIIFGLVVLAAIFVPAERVLALHPQRVLRKQWRTDIVHFAVNNIATAIGAFVVIGSLVAILKQVMPVGFQVAVRSQPFAAQFAEALVITDLFAYLSHRASHQVPFLWKFHAVHHSISEMDWLASARLHPLDQVFRQSCIAIPLFVMGFSRATFGGFLAFATFLAIYQHSNIKLRYGPLRWIVMNPQAHHWHHANEQEHYNNNFAAAFPLIDVIFGTAYIPAKQWPTFYGIDNPTPSGYLRQIAWPFRWERYQPIGT